MRTWNRNHSLLALLAIAVLATSACSAGDRSVESSPSAADATPAADPTSDETTSATTSTDSTDSADGAASTSGAADAFPVTIEHMFGETTVEEEPLRILTVGSREHELLYELGIAPVAVPESYLGYEYATGPWAEEARQAVGAEPETFPFGEMNIELYASWEPDLIIGTYSGMTEDQYDLLSGIAPTIAQSGDWPAYGMPLDAELAMIGQAVGRAEDAAAVTAEIDAAFEAARDAHPEWEGMTGAVGFHHDGNPGVYHSSDNRSQFLARLGLDVTSLDDQINDEFYIGVSAEQLDLLALDTIIWQAGSDPSVRETIEELPLFPTLEVTQQGGNVWITDPDLEGAFFANSPSSIMYSLDAFVPQLEAALDADPATEVPEFEDAA